MSSNGKGQTFEVDVMGSKVRATQQGNQMNVTVRGGVNADASTNGRDKVDASGMG